MIEVERVGEQRDCKHCSRTYGTLGCCSTVSNKWVYSCEEGHREYEETHKHMTIPEAKGRLESFIDTFDICKEHDNSLIDVSIGKEDIQAFTQAIKALEQQPCADWYDVPSNEMTLEQARQAVKDLRKNLAEYLEQKPCEDAVNRHDALNCVTFNEVRYRMVEDIKALPSVTPKKKTGHWEYVQYDGNPNIGNLHCSECNRIAGFEYNYCPNCGAKMGGDTE